MQRIDLNSDLAEGFGAYRCGDDAAPIRDPSKSVARYDGFRVSASLRPE